MLTVSTVEALLSIQRMTSQTRTNEKLLAMSLSVLSWD
jgi:hypothetical protein